MVGWDKLIEVLTNYWDNEKFVFLFGTIKITLKIEELLDYNDTGCKGFERRVRKQEDILIPNTPSVEDITKWLGLGKDYTYLVQDSHISFMDLYIRFEKASFDALYNKEFRVTHEIRYLVLPSRY